MSAEPTAPKRTFAQRVLGENPTAWAFVLPAVVIIVGLSIVPIGWSLILSFNAADLISSSQWVGLSNYDALLKDPALKDAIANEQTKVADGQAREAEAKADKAVAEAEKAVKEAEAANKRAVIEGFRLQGMTAKEALDAYLESLRIEAGLNSKQPTYIVSGTQPQ